LRLVGGTTVAMGTAVTTPVAIASAGMRAVVMAVLGEGGPLVSCTHAGSSPATCPRAARVRKRVLIT
jgi:hypothetical protein